MLPSCGYLWNLPICWWVAWGKMAAEKASQTAAKKLKERLATSSTTSPASPARSLPAT